MRIISKILFGVLLLTITHSLEARANHLYHGIISSEDHDALAREAIQNQTYYSKHHKEDSVKHSRKRSHGKYEHKRKR